LHFIHRLASRDPDYHDRRAKATFARYGLSLLLIAKFVPGLDAVTPPLAGTSRTSRLRFLSFDAVGAALYSGVYTALGDFFRHDLDRVAAYAGRAGTLLAGAVAAGLFVFAARKLVLWRRFRYNSRILHAPSADPTQSEEMSAVPCAAPLRSNL
jgi:membrane protein DedA with SNARE-associated domain